MSSTRRSSASSTGADAVGRPRPLRRCRDWSAGDVERIADGATGDELLVAVHEARGRFLTLERDLDDAGGGAFGPSLRADGEDVPIM